VAETVAGVEIPSSRLAREATDLVRAAEGDLLFDHSRRTFLFGALQGRHMGLAFDPELLYVGAMFHDLGLTETYRRSDQRFEIDGADEARRFLSEHGIEPERARLVWEGIALHTTPEVPRHMDPVVALVTAGVELDVLGIGYHDLSAEEREAVTAAHPRPDFKERILQAFTDGIKDRPDTTFGNVKADVLNHFIPSFVPWDFVEVIRGSDWPE
jgi:HD superfamily phosphodiesterase